MIDDFSKLNRRSEHIRMSHTNVKNGKKIKKFVFHKPIYDTVIKIGEIQGKTKLDQVLEQLNVS